MSEVNDNDPAFANQPSRKATADNEIRTLTLRFATQASVNRFCKLAYQFGHVPVRGYDGEYWFTVTVIFPNKVSRDRLMAAWAKESMILTE